MKILIAIFFVLFIIFEACVYYIYKNKHIITEAYQGSDVNYERCVKGGYPQKWCLQMQEPYSIPNSNPDTTTCDVKQPNA